MQQNEEKEESDLLLYENPSLMNMDTDLPSVKDSHNSRCQVLLAERVQDDMHRSEGPMEFMRSPSIIPLYRNKVSVSFFYKFTQSFVNMFRDVIILFSYFGLSMLLSSVYLVLFL